MPTRKKALLRTGRPLTIACHMKKTYFLVVSVAFLVVSDIFLLVSDIILLLVSAILPAVSVPFDAESEDEDELPLPLQAANAPIANTTSNFFIVFNFVC